MGVTANHALVLHFKCWFYVDPKKLTEHTCSLAKIVRSKIPFSPGWEVTPLQDWKVDKSSGSMVFIPLEVQIKTTKCCRKAGSKSHLTLFEEVWNALINAVKLTSFNKSIGLDKATHLICYSLWDPSRPTGNKMSRWMLPVPAEPITLPAERVEQALYNLVNIKLRRKDDAHDKCHGTAVFECVENLLYLQKLKHDEIMKSLDEFTTKDDGDLEAIAKFGEALESVDTTLATITALLWQNVGKAPSPTSRWILILLLKKIFRRRMAAVPIRDKNVEHLKTGVKRELCALQRITPLMMAHVRLCNTTHWTSLKDLFDKTDAGPEKYDMPNKMAIDADKLDNAATRKANFENVRQGYVGNYNKAIAEIEALIKACGQAAVHDSDSDDSMVEEKRGRWGTKKHGSKGCLCSGQGKEDAVDKAVEDIMNEKF